MKFQTLSLFLLVIAFSSCNFWGGERVRGNGKVVTESREFQDFAAVSVSGAIDLYVSQSNNFSVKLETDENLMEFIEVYTDGDVLRVRPRDNMNLDGSDGIKVFVSAPVFRMLGASGASSIKSENSLQGDGIFLDLSGASDAELDMAMGGIEIDMSGACKITLHGNSKTLEVDGSGSSHVKAMDLETDIVKVGLSGASSMEVHANVSLDADLSGASDVKYSGNPKVNANTSGASNVRAAN